ncbi:hypothetical protein [Streptomyces sp. NPDC002403]
MNGSEEWNSGGFFIVDGGIVEDSVWDDLAQEAASCMNDAIEVGVKDTVIRRDGSFASPSRYSVHRGGPIFQELLRSRDLLKEVRTRSGLGRLVPARCGYNYYRAGDYMGVHRDEIRATVTLTFGLTDNLGATAWVPEMRTATSSELLTFTQENGTLPEVKSEMQIVSRKINAFDGYNIPHWRMPFEHDLGILANLIYFEL